MITAEQITYSNLNVKDLTHGNENKLLPIDARKLYILTELSYSIMKDDIRKLRSQGYYVINDLNSNPNHMSNIAMADVILPKFDVTDESHFLHKYLVYALRTGKPFLSRFIYGSKRI